MLKEAHPGTLILLDEIATGTSPEEGQPLAQAIVEEFLEKGCRLFVTTHYGSLKNFAMVDARCRIASMSIDPQNRKPTYEVLLDIPGDSSAFDMALQLGFPPQVIERAKKLRGEVPVDVQSALKRFEAARETLLARQKALEEHIALAKEREVRALDKVATYERLQKEGLSESAREILKTLSTLRDELSKQVKSVATQDLVGGAREHFQKISDVSDEVRSVVQRSQESSGLFGEDLPLESMVSQANVEVEGFGIGTIVEIPKDIKDNPKALVRVQIGDLQMSVTRSRLKKPDAQNVQKYKTHKAANSIAKERKITQSLLGSSKGSSSSVLCDVRGKTLDEALRKVEGSLNELVRDEEAVITIIHGHGMDKLKDGIRTYLSKERYDVAYRAGSWPGEGGDGVTVVEKRGA